MTWDVQVYGIVILGRSMDKASGTRDFVYMGRGEEDVGPGQLDDTTKSTHGVRKLMV